MKIKLGSKRMVIKGNKIVTYAGLVVFFFIGTARTVKADTEKHFKKS